MMLAKFSHCTEAEKVFSPDPGIVPFRRQIKKDHFLENHIQVAVIGPILTAGYDQIFAPEHANPVTVPQSMHGKARVDAVNDLLHGLAGNHDRLLLPFQVIGGEGAGPIPRHPKILLQVGHHVVRLLVGGVEFVQNLVPLRNGFAGFFNHLLVRYIPVIAFHGIWVNINSINRITPKFSILLKNQE